MLQNHIFFKIYF